MSVPAFRNSRSKVRRRRSHHALSKVQGTSCAKCNAALLPHRACAACGFYKGRQVIATVEQVLEKEEKKRAKKGKEAEQSATETVEETK